MNMIFKIIYKYIYYFLKLYLLLQKLKLNDFVSPCQLPDLRKTIYYGRKSIAIRKTLPGNYHRVRQLFACSDFGELYRLKACCALALGP